jgi:hypothetical protein
MRPNLENGVLMNQLPQDLGDIMLLGRSCVLPDPAVSVRLEADRPQDYESAITIQWEGLRAAQPPQPVAFDENNRCFSPQPSVGTFPVWGGVGALTVTAGSGTAWTASTNSPWLTISSGGAGQGNRIVSYVVAANPSAAARADLVYLERVPYRIQQSGISGAGDGAQVGVFRIGDQPMHAAAPSGQAPGFGDIIDSFGLPGDQPVIGDWTGDGRIRVGIFRNGDWYLDLNGNRKWDGVEGGDGIFQFGLPGDTPVVGDWTGDGVTKLGVFRCPKDLHAECTWALDINGNRRFDSSDVFLGYGLPGDIPIVSAWSGGKIDRIGVFRNGVWYIDSNGNSRFDPSDQQFAFGLPGDVPVVSRTRGKIGVYRSGKWFLDWNGNRRWDVGDREFVFGNPNDRPLIAEW